MPAFRGVRGKLPGDDGRSGAEKDGYPIHEIVGEVIASRHRLHRPGDRVVGWASGFDGLMERVVTDGNQVAPYDPALNPAEAVGLQPLACVLYAVEQLPDLHGRHVGIIGQGSIGLLFSCRRESRRRPACHRRRPGRPRRTSPRSSASTLLCGPPAIGGSVNWPATTGRTS